MSTTALSPRRAAMAVAALVGALVAGCAADDTSSAIPPTTATTAGERTVVEHVMAGTTVVVAVVRSGGDASATMHVVTDDEAGPGILVAEERVVGTDHYVHLPAAEAVLGADVWIRFDLTDRRHRSYLQAHPVGLIDQADLPESSTGQPLVRRTTVADLTPIEAPPTADVVAFDELSDLPDLALPLGG